MNSLQLHATKSLRDPFEILKYRILSALNGQAGGPFVLAFTSSRSGEGVTNIAANFAATLAQEQGRRVLLMEADPRSPSLRSLLRQGGFEWGEARDEDTNGHGRTTWQVFSAAETFDILLGRAESTNEEQAFDQGGFAEFVNRAKERYDFIIIDCPSINSSRGSAIFASQADGAVLVVEAGEVRRQIVQRTVNILEESGITILGAVLNKRKYPIPNFLYKRL